MNETDTGVFWRAAGQAGMQLRKRALEAADRLGDGATPERIAEATMAETESDEAWRACCAFALDLARLGLRERKMPPGHELTDADVAAIENTRRMFLRRAAESCGVR